MKILLKDEVSILVLVDLALELFINGIRGKHVSFNPCFSGSCSRILFRLLWAAPLH